MAYRTTKFSCADVVRSTTTLILSKSEAGKGSDYRPASKKYYEECERLFGPSKLNVWPRDENGNLIEGEKMTDNLTGNSFGDIDKHQAKREVYTKLRAVLDDLQRHFLQDHSLVQKLQGFIPHLKRTDKDHGGLPFFSQEYVSLKPKREHCILCLVSKVVQDYWDFADDTIEDSEMVLFFKHVTILEAIVADGFTNYRVTGKFPAFYLDTVTNIEKALTAVENAAQIEAEEQAEINADQEDQQGRDTEIETDDDTNDAVNDAVSDNDSGSDDTTTAEPEVIDKTPDGGGDQLSTELADACSGDCDTCVDKVCDAKEASGIPDVPDEEDQEAVETTDPTETGNDGQDHDTSETEEHEDNIEGGVVGGGSVILEYEGEQHELTPPEESETEGTDDEIVGEDQDHTYGR